MREVLSYSRRGSRFTPSQAEAWEAYAERWVIPDEAVDDPAFSLAAWFGREAPLIVEIGPGVGEATGVLAAARPDHDVLALEVWRPGIAAGAGRGGGGGRDQRAVLLGRRRLVARAPGRARTRSPSSGRSSPTPGRRSGTTSAGWWAASSRALAASRLRPGAAWRLATDWADYAEQMREVLDAEPPLEGGVVPRWAERPVTKFERKGLRGRPLDHRPLLPAHAPSRVSARGGGATPARPARPRRVRARGRARLRAGARRAGGRSRSGGRRLGEDPVEGLPPPLVLREAHARPGGSRVGDPAGVLGDLRPSGRRVGGRWRPDAGTRDRRRSASCATRTSPPSTAARRGSSTDRDRHAARRDGLEESASLHGTPTDGAIW